MRLKISANLSWFESINLDFKIFLFLTKERNILGFILNKNYSWIKSKLILGREENLEEDFVLRSILSELILQGKNEWMSFK